uniref:rolling circle replication-associated protein n=1 Tax=Epibacterium ulvae TaxID=1156985 RepID=UPI0012FECE4C|nr:hypothetical protein [Epibacterium ulvae]
MNAATLIYSDFQKFMKRLRIDGYKVRYIVAGEYGSQKGRAHWHAVLFFDGAAPEMVDPWDIEESLNRSTPDWRFAQPTGKYCLEQNMFWKYWPHGHVYFQRAEYKGFHYLLKYALKDQEQEVSQTHLAMSKKPPLGDAYFKEYAQRYVDHGLAPQDYFYSFADVYDAKRKRRKFYLQGRMREIFMDEFIQRWREQKGTEPPISDIVEQREDELVPYRIYSIDEMWQRINEWKFLTPPPETDPTDAYWDDDLGKFHLEDIAAYFVVPSQDLLLVQYERGRIAIIQEDKEEWPVKDQSELARALTAYGVAEKLQAQAFAKLFPPIEQKGYAA